MEPRFRRKIEAIGEGGGEGRYLGTWQLADRQQALWSELEVMLGGVVMPALPSSPRTRVATSAAAHRSASSVLNNSGLLATWARCTGAWVDLIKGMEAG